MSDVRCPSCGDSFRVPDIPVPAGAMAKCPWCHDTFAMSTLVVHLPPMAELIGEDGETISMADVAFRAAPMALASAASPAGLAADFGGAIGSRGLDSVDVDFDSDDQELDAVRTSEMADDVSEFAEDGVAFAEAGYPENTAESTEWSVESDEADQEDFDRIDSSDEFAQQQGSEPRPLSSATDFGVGRDDRPIAPRARKKKSGSPIKSIIGVVVGGLMAFPLAAGILALAGKPLDLGFWPFDGQTISMNPASQRSAAPPMELAPRIANNGNNSRPGRSLAEDMPSFNGGAAADVDSVDEPINSGRPTRTPRTGTLDSVLEPQPTLDNVVESSPAPVDLPASIELPELSSIDIGMPAIPVTKPELPAAVAPVDALPAAPLADKDDAEMAAEKKADLPAAVTADEPVATEPTATSPQPASPVANAVSAQLQAALEAASGAMGEVISYDDSEGVKGQRTRLATLFSKVAEVGDFAGSGDSLAVGSLVERLVDSNLIKDLAPAAPNWVRFSKRPNNGILATGKLVRQDDRWVLQWNGPTPLEVRFDDPAIAQSGEDVIILGTISQSDPAPVVVVKYLQKQ